MTNNPMDHLDRILAPILLPWLIIAPIYFVGHALVGLLF